MRLAVGLLWCGAAALLLESTSFSSPLFPEHSRKFYMLGSAIPLRSSVRIVPGSQRKTGAIVGMNPITEKEFSVVVSGTTTGKMLAEDEGALTVWFTPIYARHIAVGTFFGVNPRIQGILVIYDHRKGLIGYEKYSEDPITSEEIPLTYQCAPPATAGFNITLSFSESDLTVEYDQSSQRIFCFRMPISHSSEQFLGISGICGYPCQRGIDLYSLHTNIVVTDTLFVEKMKKDNEKLKGILETIVGEFQNAAQGLKPKYEEKDVEKIIGVVEETKTRLFSLSTRISQWQSRFSSILTSEQSDTISQTYFQTLSQSFQTLEKAFDDLLKTSSQLNIGKVVEDYIRVNTELVGNERQIHSLVRNVQKSVGGFQAVAMSEDKFYVVYGGFGVIVGIGGFLYWKLRRAGKKHEI